MKKGALCLDIDAKGNNSWDAQLRHREMVIEQGHTYSVDFAAWATTPTAIRPKIGMSGPPYAEYWAARLELGTAPQRFQGQFTMGKENDATAEFAFHVGGTLVKSVPVTICIDDLYLNDPQFAAPAREKDMEASKVAVNQHGYLPGLKKVAVLNSDATAPQKWQVLKANGAVALEGETHIVGKDKYSGNSVHQIDFTELTEPGQGYVIQVGSDKSHAFDIGKDVYKKLKYDALAYFYHNRSGIAIEMPYRRRRAVGAPGRPSRRTRRRVLPGHRLQLHARRDRRLVRRRRPRQVRGQRRHLGLDAAQPVGAHASTSASRAATSPTAR